MKQCIVMVKKMLLNFADLRPDLLPYVVDRNPAKQGKFIPGNWIPIVILPWNLKAEVMKQLDYIRNWGGKYVTAVAHLEGL